MSLVFPLDSHWNLAIRTLIRQNFRDKYPTRHVQWSKSAAIIQDSAPRIVGVCLVEDNGFLRYLVIREEFRGKGYGTLLLKTCFPFITYLTCMSNRISFYEKNGFSLQGLSSTPELYTMTKQNGKTTQAD
jgi:GNAT superfamily N-acetyltransferase